MSEELPALPGLALVAILLFLNGLFVAAEFSYVTVRRSKLEKLAEEGNRSARRALSALGNLDYYVAASQLGITMATIALGFLGEPVIAALIEPPIEDLVGSFAPALAHTIAIATAFLFVTAMHIVFGEFAPKTIALQRPSGTVLWLALPMTIFVKIFGPAITFLNATGNAILRLFGFNVDPINDQILAGEDLAFTLESSASAGLISRRELNLARNTLTLATLTAADLMVPRNEVVGIPIDADQQQVLDIFAKNRHTRYPVFENDLDNIVGVLNAKEVVFDWLDQDRTWQDRVHRPLVLPDSVNIEHAYSMAQSEGATLIILADEYGGTSGILSVFDIIEFLAGQMPDEFQEDLTQHYQPDGSYRFSGLAHIVDLEAEFDIELPDVEAHTIGGMVMELLERIPEVGDEVEINQYRVRVESMDGNRVDEVTLTPTSSEREEVLSGR
ncbi:MAG: hemolysin family protein [Chloroflexota bacterium]